jgi:hypothetical protein
MHIDDATAYIMEYLRKPPNGSGNNDRYDIDIKNVVISYIQETEGTTLGHYTYPATDHPVAKKYLLYSARGRGTYAATACFDLV